MSPTPWLSELLPTAPHPIAEAIGGVERVRISLDGVWQFHPDPPADLALPPSAAGGWREIAVPGEWVMQGFDVPEDRPVRYWRAFDLPADWAGRTVRLRFDAVHSLCRVWINGREVGRYEGPFEVFEFDITPAVRPGRNELMLEVTSLSMSDLMAHGSIYASHPLGGISRKVTLFTTPRVPLTCLFPSTCRAADGSWQLILRGASAGRAARWRARLEPLFDGGHIIEFMLDTPASAGAPAAFEHVQAVPDALTWDCEHPRLYKLTLTALPPRGGEAAVYACRIGFREIAVVGQELHVNGRPVKLRGVNRHEIHPTRGRAGCADLARGDVELFRAANINFIRTSHYPPPEELLEACDELGMFVECESSLCWVGDVNRGPWKTRDAKSPEYLDQHLRAVAANVAAHRGHPSVLMWSLGNESAWSDSFAAAQARAKALDPTRPTIFHNINEHGGADIMNHHYPELWVETPVAELLRDRNRPLLIGETTHVQVYNRSEVAIDPGVRDLWQTCVSREWETVYAPPHVLGMAIWSGIDDLFHLPDGRVIGYGAWGIIDGWRRPKPEYWHVKKSYSPVRVLKTQLAPPAAGQPLRIPVANRFDFTDFSELTITWETATARGTVDGVRLAPRATGELCLQLPEGQRAAGEVILCFADPAGRVIEEEHLTIAAPETPAAAPALIETAASRPLHTGDAVAADDHSITLTADGATLSRAGRPYLIAAPDLMILPLEELRNTENDDTASRPVLNYCCPGRRVIAAEALEVAGGAGVRWRIEWDVARGQIDLLIRPDGALRVQAAWEMCGEISPRQYGLVLRLPGEFDTLDWERTGPWTHYPDDHIGRPRGRAVAAGEPVQPRIAPACAWNRDDSPWGSNDFRATRTNVRWAELRAADGRIVRIDGSGRQAIRAWREAGAIALFVAEFCTGGNDFFSQAYYRQERLHLKPGQALQATIDLHLS